MSDSNAQGRRRFLKQLLGGAGVLGLGGLLAWKWGGLHSAPVEIEGAIRGANFKMGHLVREALSLQPTGRAETDVIVVGGGISGLSAAYHLFPYVKSTVFDLAEDLGGNAVAGEYDGAAFPWGAHYLPLPNPECRELLDFLESFMLARGGALSGEIEARFQPEVVIPTYQASALCHSPQERLFIHGSWQNGLLPQTGVSPADKTQMDRFFDHVDRLRFQKGSDGKYLFAIPLDRSSKDAEWTALDQMGFGEWLDGEGYTADALRWYLDYCCRDDYGTRLEDVSAWAGLHYFACRRGYATNAEANAVLTWPEGNAHLVKQLLRGHNVEYETGALVVSLENTAEGVEALVYYPAAKRSIICRARKAVFAGPQFVAKHVVKGYDRDLGEFEYAPWLVANVEVARIPKGKGRPLSWDNVPYGRSSLGYIHAGHQSMSVPRSDQPKILTWYEALSEGKPSEQRKKALATSWEAWRERVLEDLEWMHPGIRKEVRKLDVWVWGHGMVKPRPGFIHGAARQAAAQALGNIHFAHTDLSGVSIFEEAFYQGLRAAREVKVAMEERT